MTCPFTTAIDLAQAIATRQVSPVEVMRQCLQRQAALGALGALGALYGLHLSVKDLIAVGG